MTNTTEVNINDERKIRLKKIEDLKTMGINPYPAHCDTHETIKHALNLPQGSAVKTVGRLMTKREMGKLTFCHLQDETDKIQIAFKQDELGSDNYKLFTKKIDTGDIIFVDGERFVTHKGEESILVKKWMILSKALLPLPDKFHGLQKEELRLRKRYLDLLLSPEIRDIFYKKAKFWDVTRSFMKAKGFFEVETPYLETTTGGAEATPFATHHNDFDLDVYLRISVGELWQKRLMAAGFEKTFEIGRVFRNEGSSPDHLQEFTNMEFYWAYANYNDGMKLAQELYQQIATEVFGTTKFKTKEYEYNLAGEWPRIDYTDEIKKQTGIDTTHADEEEMKEKLQKLHVSYEGDNRERLTDTLWKYCRRNIAGPAFLINHPKLISPLAKARPENLLTTERFQIIIAGSEVGNGYSELNDPIDQRARFELQQKLIEKGDSEAMMPDWEFVEMLEHGMPPTCGFGFGERLFSFMINKPIRESVLFPLMKPEQSNPSIQAKKQYGNQHLPITRDEALSFVKEYTKKEANLNHYLESEAVMRHLARRLSENESYWGMLGLLHDIDWEITEHDPTDHLTEAPNILKAKGFSEDFIQIILSHGYGFDCAGLKDKKRTEKIEHALACSETVTGLIYAIALMRPDKIKNLEISSVKKKMKDKKFAANVDRDVIKECEKLGLTIDEFLQIAINAMREISHNIGLI
ncbi:MAG: lysine--tRNA ligase [Candidatus Magasanikbacteria bacterium RIFOXYC2_FULL_39_8]|nr:MAG: lysine--tRNA ligase [Candidatus Magasanikbacteria bacterium RIFOXYC2_FULL_39_8]